MNGRALIALRSGIARESWTSGPTFSVLIALSAVLLTTLVLLLVDYWIGADETTLAFIYLLPVVLIAMHYGSTIGVMTSFVSALVAAYLFFPPKFSFFIADRLHIAELGFFLLLAVIASKAVEVVARHDKKVIE
jgi:two-component system, OmpR family, sensor histidine kinase KdpD